MVTFKARTNPRIRELHELTTLQPRDMKAMLKTFDRQFTEHERRLFATEGSSGGAPWRPLSARYKRWKDRHYPGRKIMTRTGKLRRSLAHQRDPRHWATWYLRPRAVLKVGTRVNYAAYHVEDRDPLQHTDAQVRRYKRSVEMHLQKKLGRLRRALNAGARAMRGVR